MIIQGDALTELKKLPSDSVDCCVTSPPYYRMRDYGAEGQIGLEDSVQEYIEKLLTVFNEVKRVLKPDGTLWINIADCYAGSGKGKGQTTPLAKVQSSNKGVLGVQKFDLIKPSTIGMKNKDLMGIPWLLAFALRTDGWYWRENNIWGKPNCMPESVKDRCTLSHEYMLMFSKSARYYYDYEAIQEPCIGNNNIPPAGSKGTFRPNSRRRCENRKSFRGGGTYTKNAPFDNKTSKANETHGNAPNVSGLRRKRSVWHVPSVKSSYKHFATYPPKLIEPCILAGSRESGTVLDPFAGTGTTGEVARIHNRDFILIDISKENIDICHQRLDREQVSMFGISENKN